MAAVILFGFFATLLGQTNPAMNVSFYPGEGTVAAHWVAYISISLTILPFGYGLWKLSLMLGRVEQGEIFTREITRYFREFAFYVFVAAALSLVLPIIGSLLLGLSAGVSFEQLAVRVDGRDIALLFVSGLLFFVAKLLGEGQRLADDARLFI